ncbi:MAG: amino acid ABC transporter substrate-binding protein [Mesorhizobium sp.]|uniref:ABC transporter substrate-binding protein n=1 Tax=Mesorhizobium sp. TaxID=1871066 RepID=UPI0011F4B914|nr:ABC transporter substrate-binding protein [Mesorhizobium sp.]TIP26314.1 MAG: amino acid ABC transporter substrate-binding protein [Mesorhizobium sp.]
MISKRSFTAAFLAAVVLPGLALADGDAPNFGNCAPAGEVGSISLTTVQADTLIVATALPNPGWWNGTSPEKTKDGFEYCLAAEIAHRAGLKHMKLMNLAWDQFIGGAATGYDIAMASASATDKRREVFDFSQNYFAANLGVAVKTGADVTAANLKDKRIGVLQGSLGADWVINTLRPNVEVSQYQGNPEMVAALMADQVDTIMNDTAILLTATAGTKGALDVVGQFETQWGVNVITPKGSANTPAVDKAVGAMAVDGTLNTLSATYLTPAFGKDPNVIAIWPLN